MLNPELLALLVCPETHQDVTLALPDEIERLNAAIGQGQVRTSAGAAVDQPVEAALIRTDRRRGLSDPRRDSGHAGGGGARSFAGEIQRQWLSWPARSSACC